jgi:hypothetical protein
MLATGLVMEARRKIVSGHIGDPVSLSRMPIVLKWTTCPCRATTVTALGIRPCEIIWLLYCVIFSRASAETFTASGLVVGSPWPTPVACRTRRSRHEHTVGKKKERMAVLPCIK